MVLYIFAFNQHVVNIYLYGFADLMGEHRVYKALICSSGVLEPKGHHFLIIKTSIGDERAMFVVWFIYGYLVIFRERVHEASSSCPTVASTIWSILGKEKLSSGHALLRSVKSMHTFQFRLFFFMRKGLAIHSWYLALRNESLLLQSNWEINI